MNIVWAWGCGICHVSNINMLNVTQNLSGREYGNSLDKLACISLSHVKNIFMLQHTRNLHTQTCFNLNPPCSLSSKGYFSTHFC